MNTGPLIWTEGTNNIIIRTGGLFDMPFGFRMKTGDFNMDSNGVLLGQSTPLDTSVGFTA